ncbi:hypothetical protein RUND412_004056 [Rhizina undulata]
MANEEEEEGEEEENQGKIYDSISVIKRDVFPSARSNSKPRLLQHKQRHVSETDGEGESSTVASKHGNEKGARARREPIIIDSDSGPESGQAAGPIEPPGDPLNLVSRGKTRSAYSLNYDDWIKSSSRASSKPREGNAGELSGAKGMKTLKPERTEGKNTISSSPESVSMELDAPRVLRFELESPELPGQSNRLPSPDIPGSPIPNIQREDSSPSPDLPPQPVERCRRQIALESLKSKSPLFTAPPARWTVPRNKFIGGSRFTGPRIVPQSVLNFSGERSDDVSGGTREGGEAEGNRTLQN